MIQRWQHWVGMSLLAVPIAVTLAVGLAMAQSQTAPAPGEGYLPSVSDLMIETIQPRHERVWRAQHQHDWEFAVYELGNL